MATTEEMSIARKILGACMTVTVQGKYQMHFDYAAHVDCVSVWDDMGSDGWKSCDNDVHLGDFHRQLWHDAKNRNGAIQLESLLKKVELLIARDEDGIPV